jgi:hypothetical protein
LLLEACFSEKVDGKIAEHVQPPAKVMLKRSNLCTNSTILNFFLDLFLKGSNLCLKSTRNPIQQMMMMMIVIVVMVVMVVMVMMIIVVVVVGGGGGEDDYNADDYDSCCW